MKIEHNTLVSDYLPTPKINKLHIAVSQFTKRNKLSFYTMIDRPEKNIYDVGIWHVKSK